jgi:hypothetical protein
MIFGSVPGSVNISKEQLSSLRLATCGRRSGQVSSSETTRNLGGGYALRFLPPVEMTWVQVQEIREKSSNLCVLRAFYGEK